MVNKILLVEDQKEFQVIVEKILKDGQHQIYFAETAAQAKQMLMQESFDLLLLDISLPDQSGLDFYCEIQNRPEIPQTPVIFLTGSENISAKVTAFSLGAEDYIPKTFNPVELKARVFAKVKKSKNSAKNVDEQNLGPFLFNLPAQRVFLTATKEEFQLTSKEYKFFFLLAKNPDVVLRRERILNDVWGNGTFVSDRSVDTCVYQLRKKLGEWSGFIESVPGEGYRFVTNAKKEQRKAA